MMRFILVTIVGLAVSGCSSVACLQPQPYQSAHTFPKLDAPAGLDVPEPDLTMRIPEVKDGPVGVFPHSKGMKPARMRCLVMPRRFDPTKG